MLAFFGAPVAHEDDPERAILAALDMLDCDRRVRAPAEGDPGHRLPDPRRHQHRAGHGRQRRLRPALRVHGPGRRGERRRADADRRRARDDRDHRDDAPPDRRHLRPRRPRRASRSRARPSRSTPSGSSAARPRRRGGAASNPSASTARWSGATSRWRASPALLDVIRAGRGRVAFIVGEPGIGKSRLLAELKRRRPRAPPSTRRAGSRAAASRTAATCPTTCSSTCPVDPRHLVLGDGGRGAGDARRASSLDDPGRGRRPRPPTPRRTSPTCSACPLRPDERDRRPRSPDVLQSRYVAATHRLLRGLAARGPVVLVCEDIHWADPASIEVAAPAHAARGAAADPVRRRRCAPRRTRPAGRSSARRASCSATALTEIRLEPLTRGRQPDPRGEPARDRVAARRGSRPDPGARRGQPVLRRGGRPDADRARRDRAAGRSLGRHRRGQPRSRSRRRCMACCWRESTSCPTPRSAACASRR